MNIETLNVLTDEGTIEVIKRVRKRHSCDNCGEPAHFKHTFLLPNARANPASKGYGKDNISWCSDEYQFSCRDKECQRAMNKMDGYMWCSSYPANDTFAHMFLYWKEIKGKEIS